MTIAVGFQCDNACPGCLIRPWVNRWQPMDRDFYRRTIAAHGHAPKFDRLILSGGEVTLEDDLIDLVRFAAKHGGFQRIRLQTNGRRLSSPTFLRALLDAGVDEFYVSLRGHNAELDRLVSGTRASFGELRAALSLLREWNVTWIANIVANARTVGYLTEIAGMAVAHNASRVEIYGFVPMTDAQVDLIPDPARLQQELQRCLHMLEREALDFGTSWIPLCLLGPSHTSPQLPETMIGTAFWERFPTTACFYEQACARAEECNRLPLPYIHRFGWVPQVLRPEPPSAPGEQRTPRPRRRPPADEWMTLLAGPSGEPVRSTSLWRLDGVEQLNHSVVFRFRGASGPFALELHPPSATISKGLPNEARTRGFVVRLTAPGYAGRSRLRLMLSLLATIERNEDGRLRL